MSTENCAQGEPRLVARHVNEWMERESIMSDESKASDSSAPDHVLEALGATPYVSVATWRKNGKEVRTPVWVARSGERLYVFTESKSGKVKRIRNNGRAAVAPCDVRGKLKGDFTPAHARILDDAATIDRAYAALKSKYGWQMWITDTMSKMTGRYDKRAMLEIVLEG